MFAVRMLKKSSKPQKCYLSLQLFCSWLFIFLFLLNFSILFWLFHTMYVFYCTILSPNASCPLLTSDVCHSWESWWLRKFSRTPVSILFILSIKHKWLKLTYIYFNTSCNATNGTTRGQQRSRRNPFQVFLKRAF